MKRILNIVFYHWYYTIKGRFEGAPSIQSTSSIVISLIGSFILCNFWLLLSIVNGNPDKNLIILLFFTFILSFFGAQFFLSKTEKNALKVLNNLKDNRYANSTQIRKGIIVVSLFIVVSFFTLSYFAFKPS